MHFLKFFCFFRFIVHNSKLCHVTSYVKNCRFGHYRFYNQVLVCLQSKLTSLKFNVSSTCERPLVPTDNENSWYEGVDGCGIQCDNPLFTSDEHHRIHVFIAVMGSLCLSSTLFTVVSHPSASSYLGPALAAKSRGRF